MNELLRKVHLTRSLNNMRLLFPNDFDFYPKTWFLPEQSQQFKDDVRYIHQQDKKHNRSQTTFIVKPSGFLPPDSILASIFQSVFFYRWLTR
jgi:hypothetical protein